MQRTILYFNLPAFEMFTKQLENYPPQQIGDYSLHFFGKQEFKFKFEYFQFKLYYLSYQIIARNGASNMFNP